MINKSVYIVVGMLVLGASNAPSVQAFPWGKVTVTNGEGDQIQIKRGILGDKKTLVEDRYGDKFEKNQSLFGLTRSTEVEALGNGAKHHHGLFGTHHTDVHTMFGDSVSENRNIFGWHSVKVDAHGITSFLDEMDGKKPAGGPPQGLVSPGQFSPPEHFGEGANNRPPEQAPVQP